ncbi:MAG: hypothetical protein KF802_08635 [Bdellovibrionaceae bacterium]|nr:hypothetical protein [Pseudobdellovibrionaceae bacterium]
MKKMFFLLSVFLPGCASIHPGKMATPDAANKTSLRVSAQKVDEYSSPANVFLDFTLENKATKILRIESVELEFPDQDKNVYNVLVGKDLIAWSESLRNKQKVANHNSEIMTGAVTAVGVVAAVAGAGNGNRGLSDAGLGVTAAGMTYQKVREINRSILKAETSRSVPEDHLYAGQIDIPADGVLRRWILINVPQKQNGVFYHLTLVTIDGEKLKYRLPLEL